MTRLGAAAPAYKRQAGNPRSPNRLISSTQLLRTLAASRLHPDAAAAAPSSPATSSRAPSTSFSSSSPPSFSAVDPCWRRRGRGTPSASFSSSGGMSDDLGLCVTESRSGVPHLAAAGSVTTLLSIILDEISCAATAPEGWSWTRCNTWASCGQPNIMHMFRATIQVQRRSGCCGRGTNGHGGRWPAAPALPECLLLSGEDIYLQHKISLESQPKAVDATESAGDMKIPTCFICHHITMEMEVYSVFSFMTQS